MEKINKLSNDPLAFYIGKAFMCKKCEINKEKVETLEKYLTFIKFYEIDAFESSDLINEHKITQAPFYIISQEGKLVDLFYEYDNLVEIAVKLLSYQKV